MKEKLVKLNTFLILFVIISIINSSKVYAEYVIQVKDGEQTWTGISASEAYEKCEELNESYSTLGNSNVKAHLTTNADWYAVSLLTYSAYGSKNANNTTGNNSGIKNFGSRWTFTASIISNPTANADNIKKLVENSDGYVETVYLKNNRDSNKLGLGLRTGELIVGSAYYDNSTAYPVTTRSGLFSFGLGTSNGAYSASGARSDSVTFRPVIWNQ